MKVIFLKGLGHTELRSFTLNIFTPLIAVAGSLALGATFVAGMWFSGGGALDASDVDPALIAQWREAMNDSEAKVRDMEQATAAQNQAIGRRLADMQARLWRMEALGARVTEAADLGSEEFDFSEPAAQGGPHSGREELMRWPDLSTQLADLGADLKNRERQLDVLLDVLADEEIQSAEVVRGRPVTWGWLSSPYGNRVDPISGKRAWHAGVDFAGRAGSDVIAVASGVVTHVGRRSGYGKTVDIAHSDGYVTRYSHHEEVLVESGEVVKKGAVIARMGSTGRSTGPHVHFEVRKDGRTVNPAKYVARRR